MQPESHNCIALSKDFNVKKGQEKAPKTVSDFEPIEGKEAPVTGVRPKGIRYLPIEDEAQVKEVGKRREPSAGSTASGCSSSSESSPSACGA